jgi:membrane glycosyltransferase
MILHRDPELRRLHTRFLPAPVERRRGDIDQSRATASAKLAEALSIEEAVSWLKPAERMAVLLDRSLLDWLATLPRAADEPDKRR